MHTSANMCLLTTALLISLLGEYFELTLPKMLHIDGLCTHQLQWFGFKTVCFGGQSSFKCSFFALVTSADL